MYALFQNKKSIEKEILVDIWTMEMMIYLLTQRVSSEIPASLVLMSYSVILMITTLPVICEKVGIICIMRVTNSLKCTSRKRTTYAQTPFV